MSDFQNDTVEAFEVLKGKVSDLKRRDGTTDVDRQVKEQVTADLDKAIERHKGTKSWPGGATMMGS